VYDLETIGIPLRGKTRPNLLKRIHIDGCRYNERLNTKTEGSKLLAYTGLCSKTYSGHTDLGTNTVCLYPAE
jgi:hypothetical protein